ncbi:type II secretion system F family protein [Streptacidiphilus fuscans]|uniref:Type II secretion system F family protein n=1 Tax=Streptacidiphilus fuscans TaxID=2789292 RepID=A0A931FCL4_9ACTN|nr:type II secretion system F family protein [Streptacidiphilus fuscans]MBF9066591.1 type II secretion system F family protein [Streptacidiphilus fuscans]
MSVLLWAGCGVLLCGGLVALIVFARGSDLPPVAELDAERHRFRPTGLAGVRGRVQLVVAVGGAALGWVLTGYVVALVIVPMLAFGLPWLLAATMPRTEAIDRLEALAEWTQRLSDVLLLGVGMEQALIGSLRTAPEALEKEIADLVGRIQSRMNPEEALRHLGDRLGDATSDKVLAALLLRVNDRGPGLSRALSDLADSVREEVRQRRVIEADRAKHRATVRWLVLILLGAAVVMSLNASYVAPYGTPLGQAVLTAVVFCVVAVVGWMARMTLHRPVPRFLEADRRSRVSTREFLRGDGADESDTAHVGSGEAR